jgi:hypothetical protein
MREEIMTSLTPAVPAASGRTTFAFERSIADVAEWLDALAVSRRVAEPPTRADVTVLEALLAAVWQTGRRDGQPGLGRGSIEQLRFREVVGARLMESDSLRHAAVKPRGYPGDFEMMRRLYEQAPSGATQRGWWLDGWLLQLCYSRAVRNRAAMMLGVIADAWVDGARRVANIACGAAPELAAACRLVPMRSITLFDQDADALSAAMAAIGARQPATVCLVARRVRDIIEERYQLPPGQDLIYSNGLYDYLSTGTAVALTARLWSALAPGGRLVIGNFATGDHRDRHVLESALDWYLRYRTAAEMSALVAGLPGLVDPVVRDDPTGALHLLIARRAA